MDPNEILTRIKEKDFYLKKPTPVLLRPWTIILIIFPLASTIGLAILAFFGFGLVATENLPMQSELTTIAAACLGLGEIGSFFASVEVFRKYKRKEAEWWDGVAIILSSLTTAAAVIIGWAWNIEQEWSWLSWVQYNSPIVLSILAVIDTALAGSEAGMNIGEGATEVDTFQTKYEAWVKKQERMLKKMNDLMLKAEWETFQLELENRKASMAGTQDASGPPPPGYVPQTEDKVMPLTGPTERCWCGMDFPEGKYTEHVETVHVPEIRGCKTAQEAMRILKRKYRADKNFPTMEGLGRWIAQNPPQ